MKKYSFKNDYSEGMHPALLNALAKTNYEQQEGYSEDDYCEKAANVIKSKIKNLNADIHFVSGGTQANAIVISSFLKSYEGVIAAVTGHINVHEAGAIEACGRKILTVFSDNGKVKPADIIQEVEKSEDHHMVKPGMVYISNSTEVGSVYNKEELIALSEVCRKNNLLLYMDGARLGSALCSQYSNLSLQDISELTDVFYMGGTKNGAIMGEAIVLTNDILKKNFKYYLKQRGALLSKGRLMGVQFLELFRENLYFELAKHSNIMAKKIADAIKSKGYQFLTEPQSNQIFPVFPKKLLTALSKKYDFYIWQKMKSNTSAIRLVTSWATPENIVNEFIKDICEY